MNCMMNFWWLMMYVTVRTKLTSSRRSRRSRENIEIRDGSSNSLILRIPRCPRKIYSLSQLIGHVTVCSNICCTSLFRHRLCHSPVAACLKHFSKWSFLDILFWLFCLYYVVTDNSANLAIVFVCCLDSTVERNTRRTEIWNATVYITLDWLESARRWIEIAGQWWTKYVKCWRWVLELSSTSMSGPAISAIPSAYVVGVLIKNLHYVQREWLPSRL